MLLVGSYSSYGTLSHKDGETVLRFQLCVMNRVLHPITKAVIFNNTWFTCVWKDKRAEYLFRKAAPRDTLSIEGYLQIKRPPPIDGEHQPQVFTIICQNVEWMPPQVNSV